MRDLIRQLDGPNRRDFVVGAAHAFLGVSVIADRLYAANPPGSPVAAPNAPVPGPSSGKLETLAPVHGKAKSVIYLFMNGGMSHLDTLDPKKEGSDIMGPTKVLSTKVPGIQVGQVLSKLAQQMDKVCLVRSLTSSQGAHERGQYFMRTSYTQRATIVHPGMGAWASALAGKLNPRLPANVLVNGGSTHPGAGFLEGKHAPVPVGDADAGIQDVHLPPGVTEEHFNERMRLANTFDKSFRARYPHKQVKAYSDFYMDAVRLMKSEDLKAFDIGQEPQAARDAYGNNPFGNACLLARRLVEHKVRFIEVGYGNWDTHNDNFDNVADRAAELDQGLSALLADLSAKGLLKDTMVVLATEFGRSPKINEREGRDHHPKVFSCALAGGGVRGGQVWGSSDDKGHDPKDNPVSVQDFNATIAYALGLPLDKEVVTDSGRPMTLADKGKPLTKLF